MKKAIGTIAMLAVVVIVIVVFIIRPAKSYNHGICPNCGIPYKEVHAINNGNSYTKFRCEECGKWSIVLDWLK